MVSVDNAMLVLKVFASIYVIPNHYMKDILSAIAVVYSLLQDKSNTKLPKRQSCRGASSVERRPTIKSWQYVMGIKMHHPEIQNAESFLNDNPLFWAKVSKDKVSSKAPNIENRRDHNKNIRYLQKSEKVGQNCELKYRIFESSNPKMAFERTTGRSVNM